MTDEFEKDTSLTRSADRQRIRVLLPPAWTGSGRWRRVRFEAAFRRARAAEAWSRSLGPIDRESAAEALYEAIHAFGGGAQAEAVVTRLIHA